MAVRLVISYQKRFRLAIAEDNTKVDYILLPQVIVAVVPTQAPAATGFIPRMNLLGVG